MFVFSVTKDMTKRNNNDNMRIPTHRLAHFLTLIVKELKISVKHGRVVTTLNTIKTLYIISSVTNQLTQPSNVKVRGSCTKLTQRASRELWNDCRVCQWRQYAPRLGDASMS